MQNNPKRPLAFVVAGVAALVLGLSSCGSDDQPVADKAAVAGALKKEVKENKALDGLPKGALNDYIDCSAAAIEEHGDQDDVQAFVDGEKKVDDVKPKRGSDLDKEYESCSESTLK